MNIPFSIVNRDGHTLLGVVTLPSEEGRFPVVLSLHGFGANKCGYKNLHMQMARALEKAGIACVRFDFYGNGESDGEFSDMTFPGLLGDTEDVMNWIKEQSWADTDRISLTGQSMGGYVAATAAPSLKPHKLILQCPGADMWKGCMERVEMLESKGIFTADVEGLPFSTNFNKTMYPYEPFETADGYVGPVLLVRGTADNMVGEETCQNYCKVYGEACTLHEIEGANHNFAAIPHRAELFDVMVKFLC